jgi:hypothetical protein
VRVKGYTCFASGVCVCVNLVFIGFTSYGLWFIAKLFIIQENKDTLFVKLVLVGL